MEHAYVSGYSAYPETQAEVDAAAAAALDALAEQPWD